MSMQKRINFFVPVAAKQADAKHRMQKIIHICIWISVAMSLITFLIYTLQLKLNSDIDTITSRTKEVQDAYALQLANQTKLSIINTRLKTIITAEKTDLDFLTKKQKFENILNTTSTPKTVSTLSFTQKGEFTATLDFSSKAQMKSFIAELESQQFQNKVKLLTVGNLSFNLIESKDVEAPQMNISGELL